MIFATLSFYIKYIFQEMHKGKKKLNNKINTINTGIFYHEADIIKYNSCNKDKKHNKDDNLNYQVSIDGFFHRVLLVKFSDIFLKLATSELK